MKKKLGPMDYYGMVLIISKIKSWPPSLIKLEILVAFSEECRLNKDCV
jgi:hypothetical protein